jgi:hypothetical protein
MGSLSRIRGPVRLLPGSVSSRNCRSGLGGTKLPLSRPYCRYSAIRRASIRSVFLPRSARTVAGFTSTSSSGPPSRMFQTGIRRVGGGAPSYPGAGHRPPLKRGVRFSRATLSRRRPFLRCNGRNQFYQLDQPILAVHFGLRQLFPAAVAPAFIPMRPDASRDPTVEVVEECSDVARL